MSNQHYSIKWKTTINELMINLDYENQPRDENEGDLGLKYKRNDQQWFEYYGHLYVRYIDCYKRLEDCYDQMLHPQKRMLLKSLLENTMLRLLQVKQNLIYYNTNTLSVRSEFPNLDKILMELKVTPNVLELPVPRHCREENFDSRNRRNQMIDKLLVQFHDTNLPEEEVVEERSTLDANLKTAIRILQKNERGRQGIERALKAKQIRKTQAKQEKQRELLRGGVGFQDEAEREDSVLQIQTYFRGYKAREKVWMLREAEYEFLGMSKKKEDPKDKESEIYRMNQKRLELKKLQAEQQTNYQQAIDDLKSEYQDLWSDDIRDKMLEDRRTWIRMELERNEYRNLPRTASEFYEKDKVKHPLTPEEEEFERMLMDQKAKEKKKAKDAKKAGKKGKKKKLTDREEFQKERTAIGPTEAVLKIQENIEGHTKDWAPKKEYENFEQGHDEELVKQMILPEVEKNVQSLVDEIIDVELGNLRLKYKIKKKKGKKKKKKKAKKKRAKKVPGAKSCKNRDPRDMLAELIEAGIVKKLAPAHLEDMKGGVNMLRMKQEQVTKVDKDYPSQPDPSIQEVRNYLVENIAIPMGSPYVRENVDRMNYFHFFGPHGSGKTMAIRALQTELDAMVVDLSPSTVESKYPDKASTAKMLYMAFTVAKEYQPSIIYIDEIDEIFKAGKKKKKKKAIGDAPAGPSFVRLKKPLTAFKKAKYLAKEDRVVVISCTAKPWQLNKKMIKAFSEKRIYFPFPDYGTRKLLFQHLMEVKAITIPHSFPLSTIAHITEGFTAGNYKEAIFKVLTERRIQHLNERALTVSEFINPLSNQPTTYAQEYQKFRELFDDLSGVKARRGKLLEPPDDDGKKKKAAPKKKK